MNQIKMKTIFVGNGLNYLGNDNCSWENLLRDLISTVRKEHIIDISQVPFPILYEEIILRGIRFSRVNEDTLMEKVIEKMGKMKPNNSHELLANSGVDNIITTNYDYNIEKTFNHNFIARDNIGKMTHGKPETKYRLYTFNKIHNKKIWHIHGELDYPHTIMLGQDRYANSLRKIIEHTENNIPIEQFSSWIDLFFTSDVHIIGFGFDYSEIDLWWIINYRARLKYVQGNDIKNKIVYHVKRNTDKKNLNYKNKKRLLESHDVIVKEYDESYYELYERALSEINLM